MENNTQTETNTESKRKLLAEFAPASYENWRTVVERDLKGASFEKKLVVKTAEGIDIQPMYVRKDLESVSGIEQFPGANACLRSAKAAGYRAEPWIIAQSTPAPHPSAANQAILEGLSRGQNAVNVPLDRMSRRGCNPGCCCTGKGGVSLSTLNDWKQLLDQVHLDAVPLYFNATASAPALAAQLFAYAESRGFKKENLSGSLGYDPLGALAEFGDLKGGWDAAQKQAVTLARHNNTEAPRLGALDASGLPYHEAGASATQELAFALATAVEYMRTLTSAGMSPDAAAAQIRIVLGVGTTLFMEIAKFRAARVVWSRALKAFGAAEALPRIHARTGNYTKTLTDPYVNMLRTSTEAFSAVVGGCDSLDVSAFDEVIRTPDTFSRRIARNTHIILGEECNLDRVIDPAGGSWYIETLTAEVAKGAWEIFQEVEKQGGLFKSLQTGYPQEEVAKTSGWRTKRLDSRAYVQVGLNMYANVSEKPLQGNFDKDSFIKQRKQEVETFIKSADYRVSEKQLQSIGEDFSACIEAAAAGATLNELSTALRPDAVDEVSELCNHRLSERYEALRAAADAHTASTGARPKIFLVNMGPTVQHKLRADFIRGFFECGGFEIEYPDGFADAETAAEAMVASGAKVAVICSTDATYPELVPAVTQAIKAKSPSLRVLLAGHPGDNEATYKTAGLDDFIFIKSNHYATLKDTLDFATRAKD